MAENIYMYVFNTLSDWEPSYIVSELNSGRAFKKTAGKYNVKTFGLTKDPVTTMGGIKILPDLTIDEISAENTALLLLPGGDTWMDENNKKVLEKTREFLDRGILVAAICGATQALASAGMLNDRIHTSNGVAIVKHHWSSPIMSLKNWKCSLPLYWKIGMAIIKRRIQSIFQQSSGSFRKIDFCLCCIFSNFSKVLNFGKVELIRRSSTINPAKN